MKNGLRKIKRIGRRLFVSIAVTVVCSVGIVAFSAFYFSSYQDPDTQHEVFELTEGWQYETPRAARASMDGLDAWPEMEDGETLTLYKTLDVDVEDAAVLVRTNHQSVDVFLDGVPLYADSGLGPEENPGLAQRIVALPEGYFGKTLEIELTSPYAHYAGRVSPVRMGTVSSLEAYVHSESLRPLIMMVVCFVAWAPIVAVGFVRRMGGTFHKDRLAIGVFAVIWALFFVSAEYDVFPFFTPVQRSLFSQSMYFLIPVPFSLFFYFSFERYKKWMQPAVVLHCGFAAAALALQFSGAVDLPRMMPLNDVALAGTLYAVVLTAMEAKKNNRSMKLTLPFLLVAYGFMIFCFYIFYTRRISTSYYYRDFYFVLILAVLVYSIWHFFRDVYRQAKENEMFSMQERLMRDSYENFKVHLRETAGLKHDIKNHFAAIRTYLEHGRIEEAQSYLACYAGQSATVTEAAYSEHFLMNAVVGSLYQRAKEHGVRVEAGISAVPTHITDPDLYSLLSNLADNALEACAAMPEGRERFVCLAVTKCEPYLSIRCVNSKAGEVVSADGKIQTTKSGDGHGYGLWIVRRIVDDYDGMMNVEHDDKTFTVTLALKDK